MTMLSPAGMAPAHATIPGVEAAGLAVVAGEALPTAVVAEAVAVVCATGVDPPQATVASINASRATPTRTRQE
jgi:hypothetical protein